MNMNRNEFSPANRDSRRLSESALTWGAVILALGYLWFRLINNLRLEWTTNPQYGYGLLVPFLCIGLLVRRWHAARSAGLQTTGLQTTGQRTTGLQTTDYRITGKRRSAISDKESVVQ